MSACKSRANQIYLHNTMIDQDMGQNGRRYAPSKKEGNGSVRRSAGETSSEVGAQPPANFDRSNRHAVYDTLRFRS